MTPRGVIGISGWAHDGSELEPVFQKLTGRWTMAVPAADLMPKDGVEVVRGVAEAMCSRLTEMPDLVDLIGWSLGAIIALQVARAAPERVRRLVLFSPCSSFVRRPGYGCGMPEENLRALGVTLVVDRNRALREFFKLCGETREDGLDRRILQARSISVKALRTGVSYLRQVDLRGTLKGVTCPVLLVHGEHDQVIRVEAGELLHGELSESRIVRIPGVGHLVPENLPEEIANGVTAFLSA